MAIGLFDGELELDEFELPDSDSNSGEVRYIAAGPCCRLLIGCVAVVVFCNALFWSPPDWLQPTIVGMLWGSLFLVGAAAGSVRRGSGLFALAAGSCLWLSQYALKSLTSLVAAECALIVVCSFAAGWLVTQFEFSGRAQSASNEVRRYQQWTIWDLAVLTTLVAVICYALPRLESPLMLLTQVGFVLLGGCVFSWLAYRWVFDDCWTMTKLAAMLLGGAVCIWLLGIALLGRGSHSELSLTYVASWMLTGPIAVIAAQGLTVLAILAAVRIDAKTSAEPDAEIKLGIARV